MANYPTMFRVRQTFEAPRVADVAVEVHAQLSRLALAGRVRAGQSVAITAGSRLHAIIGRESLTVNSSHHQAIKTLASPLQITARAEDGIVEGIELPGEDFVLGVQWHPETMDEMGSSRALLEAFLASCREKSAER